MKWAKNAAVVTSLIALLTACGNEASDTNSKPDAVTEATTANATENELISFEQFTLDNGLKVVMHIDKSDPVVAVALTSHVGSAREKPGRTGFAHLFEHLLFLESENLGKGGLDKLSARIGGSGANGSTSRDRTNYFQTVPNDALEKMIWAEADKLGFFINTVTEPVLAKEKQVVKNEKRQGIDNQPYGHTFYVVDKNLYPEGHPYNWQVIGSLEDLQNATLEDVKEFFRRWYVPNNVTLTIAGDFDPKQAKIWVEKYFGEIKRGEDISRQDKQPASLSETKKRFYEDNFARTPQLLLTWPGVHQYHKDSYALDILITYLSEGKNAPLNKVLIDDKKLTTTIFMFNRNSELAGQTMLGVRAFDGVKLDDVQTAIDEAFADFETNGISETDLARVKAGAEVDFYSGIQSVLGKAFQLAQYDIFAGDPGFINDDIKNIQAVTSEDVMRVYTDYIKDKNYVAVSTVPKGQADLVLSGSTQAEIVEEQIVQGAEETFDASITAEYERTPSSFDRTIEPEYGPEPILRVPAIWENTLSNGLKIYGIEDSELPLVRFDLTIEGGQLLDDLNKVGVANLVGELMQKGTKNRTTAELEEAIEALGAELSVTATAESIRISGTTLAKNLDETLAIFEEVLLEPRWDEQEFELAKLRVLNQLEQEKSNPNAIADNAFATLIYGENHILSRNILGNKESVENITLDDLKVYYQTYFSPSVAKLHVVGDVSKTALVEKFAGLSSRWASRDVTIPNYSTPQPLGASKVYFYDVPGAKQSIIRFGYPALKRTNEDFYAATLMNYRLGGGGFASRLTQELREGKGYTYGIGSQFSGTKRQGEFTIFSGVRSNITLEATMLVKDILSNYGNTFTEQDLTVTKGFQLKSKARAFETPNAKLGLLRNISTYNLPYDYVIAQNSTIRDLTVEEVQRLAEAHIRPDQMIYLVVGDAATQLDRLSTLGYGTPILLNK
ncbi:pitrilysin family protein [Kordiimonas sp. SCSIO 12610]|uniref:M16 family metallopeptidase n=1 Tax=Kordiimonas sp. SCSIO 12610 TaxID=2829597 RepID=UPI00210ED948|nr:pitrilysin family protein [Kordiimonas sp. SCSIO 12610]UTW55124.1 insulinase family protein [Kordiimonas sp. SCSIO 12610]